MENDFEYDQCYQQTDPLLSSNVHPSNTPNVVPPATGQSASINSDAGKIERLAGIRESRIRFRILLVFVLVWILTVTGFVILASFAGNIIETVGNFLATVIVGLLIWLLNNFHQADRDDQKDLSDSQRTETFVRNFSELIAQTNSEKAKNKLRGKLAKALLRHHRDGR